MARAYLYILSALFFFIREVIKPAVMCAPDCKTPPTPPLSSATTWMMLCAASGGSGGNLSLSREFLSKYVLCSPGLECKRLITLTVTVCFI